MKKCVKVVSAAVLFALLLVSCSKEQPNYYRLKYEAISFPETNMYISFQHPGFDNMFGTGGSRLLQDCGYVKDGFEARIKADAIPIIGYPQDVEITLRIFVDDVCKAEITGVNSATVDYFIGKRPTE